MTDLRGASVEWLTAECERLSAENIGLKAEREILRSDVQNERVGADHYREALNLLVVDSQVSLLAVANALAMPLDEAKAAIESKP